ncbi:MAG: ParB/RepB/Spo0J family partition protein [Methylococcaceae bacterium]|nr:ParB/RepB/Spo0J family partition protein [Methylococcaceae bacterium]
MKKATKAATLNFDVFHYGTDECRILAMNENKKQSPLDKLKSMSMDNLDKHRASEPIFSLIGNDGESQPVAMELIDPNPWQPRREFQQDKIEQLAESIDVHGLIEPIVVRKHENRFQIIVGERRWRAHNLLKKSHINAIVKCADDMQMVLIAVAENVDREDLSDYEVALAIQSIKDRFESRAELARYLKKTRVELYRYLAFMELPVWLRESLDNKPSLLNRTAAEDLKRMFAKEQGASEKYHEATMKAIELIETGALSQIRMVSEIELIASMQSGAVNQTAHGPVTKRVASNKNSQESEPMLFLNKKGKAVGNLRNNGKKITLTLSCTALNDEQERALQEFVNNLVRNVEQPGNEQCESESS